MTRRGVAVTALIVLALAVPAGAQAPSPAWLRDASPLRSRVETRHLIAEAEAVDLAGATQNQVTLRLRVTPRQGMRIYAHDVVGYTPFSVRLDPTAGVTAHRVVYPPSAAYVFPPTGETSIVYTDTVTVEYAVVLADTVRRRLRSDETATLPATLRYQACDDRLCYRPETVRIAWQAAR